jgi:hypothetical protein
VHSQHSIHGVKKVTNDAGPQHEGGGKFRNPQDPAVRSMLMAGFSDCSTWMTAFSITLWACITLGLCNSSYIVCKEGYSEELSVPVTCKKLVNSLAAEFSCVHRTLS